MRQQQHNQDKIFPLFSSVHATTPISHVSKQELYELFKTPNQKVALVQERCKKEIYNNHPQGTEIYQREKRASMQAVLFSSPQRHKDYEITKMLGLMCFDLDNNKQEELDSFAEYVESGKIKWIEALGLSFSGFLRGSRWATVKIEAPVNFTHLSTRLCNLLGIKKADKWADTLTKIHKAYYRALRELFKQNGIVTGGSAEKYKQPRYISPDPNLYVNYESDEFTLTALEIVLKQIKTLSKKSNTTQNKVSTNLNIDSSDAFSVARNHVENNPEKEFAYEEGQGRYDYIFAFSSYCNLLGVDFEELKKYAAINLPSVLDEHSRALNYPYKKYSENFGSLSYLVDIQKPMDKEKEAELKEQTLADLEEIAVNPSLTIFLKDGEYLSSKADLIIEHYKEQAKTKEQVLVDLAAGMGSGKSVTITKYIAPAITKLNGCKGCIILPLNSKTEQESSESGLLMITGESLAKGGESLAQIINNNDLFLCNQNTFPKIANFIELQGKKLNTFVDEQQTLVTGQHYKGDVTTECWEAIKRVSKTITLYSGTPKPYFTALGAKRIQVIQESRAKIEMVFRHRLKNIEKTVLEFIAEKEQDLKAGKKIMFKIQSKKKIRTLKKLLETKGYKVAVLYSDEHVKASDVYRKFKNASQGGESFADDIQIILVTSFINEGVNVYSLKDIIPVNLERFKTMDVDNAMQFPDRHRAKSDKVYYSYHPFDDEQKTFGYNRLADFKNHIQHWSDVAKHYTSIYQLHKKSNICEQSKVSLLTEFSNENIYLIFNKATEVFAVNELEIMSHCEKIEVSRTTVNKAISDIKRRFSYVTVVDERKQIDNSKNELDKQIKVINDMGKAAKLQAQNKIYDLQNDDLDLVLQAICFKSSDTKIKFKSTARDMQAVKGLIKNNTNLFTTHFSDCEHFAKRYFKLLALKFTRVQITELIFKQDNEHGHVLRSHRAFSDFMKDYKLHMSLELYKTSEDVYKKCGRKIKALTFLQVREIRRTLNIIDDIEKAMQENNKIYTEQIYKIVFKRYKGTAKIKTHMTKHKAGVLFNLLFDATQKKEEKDGEIIIYYNINKRRDFSDVFASFDKIKKCQNIDFVKMEFVDLQ